MATKLRNTTTGIVTKVVLFAIILSVAFILSWRTVTFVADLEKNNISGGYASAEDFFDSWRARTVVYNQAEALISGEDMDDMYTSYNLPVYHYRMELGNGQVISNTDQSAEDLLAQKYSKKITGIDLINHNGNGVYKSINAKDGTYSYTATEDDELFLDEDGYELEPDEWLKQNPQLDFVFYFAYDEQSMGEYEVFWRDCRLYMTSQITFIVLLLLPAGAAFIWLLVTCGRKPGDDKLHMLPIDRLWTEVIVAALACSIALCILPYGAIFGTLLYLNWAAEIYMINMLIALFLVGIAIAIAALLSLVRLLKAHRFWRNSLCWKVIRWLLRPAFRLWDLLRSFFDQRAFAGYPAIVALQKRQKVFIIVLGATLATLMLLSLVAEDFASFFFIIFATVGIGIVTYWHLSSTKELYKTITQGVDESLIEQMKSERTKTALITNVSHDLKTPLTSIITYIDLLQKEELGEAARDYVTILAQKSERLKSIVSDLFDLSKSAAGSIPLEMEKLDMHRLLEQTLADMQDKISASDLVVKTRFPESELYIFSDGKKLYRVFQNLIDNALKYSMPGSRIYVSLAKEDGKAVACVRNTSSYEMEFTPEEILQRFYRGDKSRSGDGSGLGLSIAESFTRACGGDFQLDIDGDLFKVTISFELTGDGQDNQNTEVED